MDTNKIKFRKLNKKLRILLLTGLGYKLDKLECQFCGDKLKGQLKIGDFTGGVAK